MAVLGPGRPDWVAVLEASGPEIAVALMTEIANLREVTVGPDLEHQRVLVICSSRYHDHYGIAFEITEALSSFWDSEFAGTDVGLRIHINALQVDVPGGYFTDPGGGVRRRRWATLSRSQLSHQV